MSCHNEQLHACKNLMNAIDMVYEVNRVGLFAQKTFDKFIPVEGDQENIQDSL